MTLEKAIRGSIDANKASATVKRVLDPVCERGVFAPFVLTGDGVATEDRFFSSGIEQIFAAMLQQELGLKDTLGGTVRVVHVLLQPQGLLVVASIRLANSNVGIPARVHEQTVLESLSLMDHSRFAGLVTAMAEQGISTNGPFAQLSSVALWVSAPPAALVSRRFAP